jgi:hypothetical protein
MHCFNNDSCDKSTNRGDCTVYPDKGVDAVNKGFRTCCFISPDSVPTVPTVEDLKDKRRVRVGQQKQKRVR